MYKKIVIGLVFVLLIVGFSGCTEQETSVNPNKVELFSYEVKSDYIIGDDKDGFVYSDELIEYNVTGIIKNIDNEFIYEVTVIAYFQDINGTNLSSRYDYVKDLASGYTKEFTITFGDMNYLEYTKGVKFEFKLT